MTSPLINLLRHRVAAFVGHLKAPSAKLASLLPGRDAGFGPDPLLKDMRVGVGPEGGLVPSIGAMFAAARHESARPGEALAHDIRELAEAIDRLQPGYQPVYGFLGEFPGKRREHLDRNVRFVEEALEGVRQRHQVRILDVGCNIGYVTLRLAENFPNVVGLDISEQNLQLCRLLAVHAESSARFFQDDLLSIVASGEGDLEQVDVVLLYNVVHQFIFHHGLAKTQGLLAELVRQVDTVIVELASKADYERHGKDHLLPEQPEDALAGCVDVEITKLHDRPRPVYRLRRKNVRLGNLEIRPKEVDYSPNPDPRASRKYYRGEGKFLKLYRFTNPNQRQMVDREISALAALQHTEVVPRLLGHRVTERAGAVLMSLVSGERLLPRVYHADRYKLTDAERLSITRQYLEIARAVHEAVGYQNDLQAHNLLVRKDGSLVLVDFEQAGSEPINDPFGLLLWSVFDFWGGRDKNRPAAILSLRASKEGLPPREEVVYPDFSGLALPQSVSALVAAATAGGEWGEFLDHWIARLRDSEPLPVVAPD
jgi:SAM-dependent methyltransferase